MRPPSADMLLRLLSEVVNLLLQGELQELVRPYVCGASVSWPSLWPIAILESFRRLTSKVLVDLITDHARTILEPLQLGVKTANGCEAHHSPHPPVVSPTPFEPVQRSSLCGDFQGVHHGASFCGLASKQSARISHRSPGWTDVIHMRALLSRAPTVSLLGSSPVQRRSNRVTP